MKPRQFGHFLIAIFDEWVRHDVGKIFVQTFEAAVRNWLRLPSSGMCVFNATCGHGLALEHNGDLYSCDHFVEPKYLLGNISKVTCWSWWLPKSSAPLAATSWIPCPAPAGNARSGSPARGNVPRTGLIVTPNGEPGLNYLCAGYKAFFHHIDRPLKIMAQLLRQEKPAAQVMEVLAAEEAAGGHGVWQGGAQRSLPLRQRP